MYMSPMFLITFTICCMCVCHVFVKEFTYLLTYLLMSDTRRYIYVRSSADERTSLMWRIANRNGKIKGKLKK